jgi:hypothetical protein
MDLILSPKDLMNSYSLSKMKDIHIKKSYGINNSCQKYNTKSITKKTKEMNSKKKSYFLWNKNIEELMNCSWNNMKSPLKNSVPKTV